MSSLSLLCGCAVVRPICSGVIAVFVLAVAASASLAAGALLRVDAGEVLVNTGDGFKAIASGSEVPPGSQVLASPNTVAAVVYPDGTVVPIQPGAMIYVSASAGAPGVPGATVQAEWQTQVTTGAEDTPVPAPGAGGMPNSTLLMIAGVGAAAGGIVALASGGGSSPASP